jgi:acetyltransferase
MGDIRKIFNPGTVALVGATEREGTIGRDTLVNLLGSGHRQIFPVNPNRDKILGLDCYPTVAHVPPHIDLAVIATPAATVPAIVEACGEAGVDGIIIISAGFREVGLEGKALEDRIVDIRKQYGMRIVGPNCVGVISPHTNLNASFIKAGPEKGKIAFISQSGAFGRALLDWGISAHIGFSMFASLGSMIDVDFADLIDFLAEDPHTKSIMVYVEGHIGGVKKLIGAARGFARTRPIILLKPALPSRDSLAPLSHTGTLAGSEQVFDAVFKRTGVVRVKNAVDLFNAASVLDSRHLPKGARLLIITNAYGVGIMAMNALTELGGELARLSDASMEALDSLLPPSWSRDNPIHILRDADVERYIRTLSVGLADPGVDGVLIICTPQGVARSDELAGAIALAVEEGWKPVITSCIGGKEVHAGRELLIRHSIPTYDTPEEAAKTYFYMYKYEKNLELLYETPAELSVDSAPPKNNLKALIRRSVKEGAAILTEEESMRFLANYGIPTVSPYVTANVDQALAAAREIGYPVVLKVASPDIIYRVDVGGVITGITSDSELKDEYHKLKERVRMMVPSARVTGITVQKMLEMIDYEIILGAKKDKDCGSVILFGMGGVGVEVFRDFSIGLPPLNQTLARRLMEETKVYGMLKGYRGKPPADLRRIEEILVSFSNLIVDFPEIAEMDVNPVAISRGKAYALGARIVIDKSCVGDGGQYSHLVISPYPTRYIMPWTLADGTQLLLRPIKPEDEPLIDEMYSTLSDETFRGRFFQANRRTTHEMHIRQCSVDYDREMGIVAEDRRAGKRSIVAIGGLIVEPGLRSGEYAVLVRDDYHGKGLGYKIVDILIGVAQEKGLEEIYGVVLTSNRKMLKVCRRLGFAIEEPVEDLRTVRLLLK